MKILLVSNSFWNVKNFRGGLVEELLKHGHDLYIAAPVDNSFNHLVKMGATCIELSFNRKGLSILKEISLFFRIKKIFISVKPDYAFTFTIKPNLYSSFFSIRSRVIPNISGLGSTFLGSKILTFFIKILYKISLISSEKVFFQNYEDHKYFISEKLVNKEKASVIPGSGVNLNQFSFNPSLENPYSDKEMNEKIIILYAGRLIKDKGVNDFIDAAKIFQNEKINNVQFICLGDLDPDNPSALTKKELDLCIDKKLIKHYPFSEDVRNFIQFSDCVVLPSLREGLSKILLEAMSMSKPIIATNVPGCKELIIDGQNGFLAPPMNPTILAQKIKLFCSLTKDQKVAFGLSSRNIAASKYDEKFVIQKYLELLGQG